MIRKTADLQSGPSKSTKNTNNDGAAHDPSYNDVFENDMELDDPDKDDREDDNSSNWDEMETEDAENNLKYQELLQNTIEYGQALRLDYRDDPSKEVKKALEDTFSLMAYDDPRTSVHGDLLENGGRVPVAEELNSAILGKFSPQFPRSHLHSCSRGILTHFLSIPREDINSSSRATVPANRSAGQRDQ